MFRGSCNRTALRNALNTDAAPCLSICIPEIFDEDFRCNPPESKHTPLPTKEINEDD